VDRPAVALVLVSHSRALAEGAAELAGQMAPDVLLLPAGGTDDGRLGTGFDVVSGAIEQAVSEGRSAVLLTDLGSALLTAESVLEMADADVVARVRLADAPFVEGAVAAAVAAQDGAALEDVADAARAAALTFGGAARHPDAPAGAGEGGETSGWAARERGAAGEQTGTPGAAGSPGALRTQAAGVAAGGRPAAPAQTAEPRHAPDAHVATGMGPEAGADRSGATGGGGTGMPTARGTAVLRNRFGLHARPAAHLARTAAAFRSAIEVNGVDVRSVLSLVSLGAVGGTHLVVTATGADAPTAVRAIVAELEEGFGEA